MKWYETDIVRKMLQFEQFVSDAMKKGRIPPSTVQLLDECELAITQPLGFMPRGVNQLKPEHEPTPEILQLIHDTQKNKLLNMHPELESSLSQWMEQRNKPNTRGR